MPTSTPSSAPATSLGYGFFKAHNDGFTLIEMVVVMVLLGLLAAVTLPNLERWFAGTQERVDASRVALQVQKLLARAAILNQSIELTSSNLNQSLVDGKPALDLPVGWKLRTQDHLTVHGSGYCVPSEITFVTPQQQLVTIQVKDQQCNVGFTLQGGRT
jgi:prepilin-type N-terminal cleavage/methylation domain-containing protein